MYLRSFPYLNLGSLEVWENRGCETVKFHLVKQLICCIHVVTMLHRYIYTDAHSDTHSHTLSLTHTHTHAHTHTHPHLLKCLLPLCHPFFVEKDLEKTRQSTRSSVTGASCQNMVDSWYCQDRVAPAWMGQVARQLEVRNHKRRTLISRLSSSTSAGTFDVSVGPYINYRDEAGTKNEPEKILYQF